MHEWLNNAKPSDEDEARLTMLGNVVVPQCAQLGSCILQHVIQGQQKQ